MSGVFKAIGKVFKGIGKVVKKVVKGVGKLAKKVVGGIGKVFGKLGPIGSIAMSFLLPGIGGFLTKLPGVGGFFSKAMEVGSAIFKPIKAAVSGITKGIGDVFTKIGGGITEGAKSVWDSTAGKLFGTTEAVPTDVAGKVMEMGGSEAQGALFSESIGQGITPGSSQYEMLAGQSVEDFGTLGIEGAMDVGKTAQSRAWSNLRAIASPNENLDVLDLDKAKADQLVAGQYQAISSGDILKKGLKSLLSPSAMPTGQYSMPTIGDVGGAQMSPVQAQGESGQGALGRSFYGQELTGLDPTEELMRKMSLMSRPVTRRLFG